MEKCRICELEGIVEEFKDGRGLNFHLKSKHNGMKLDEYREKYGEKKPVEEPVEEESKQGTNELEQETTEPIPEIIIKDYKLLNNSNLSAMFVNEDNGVINTFRKIIAIGSVEIENSNVISAMIIDDNGLLTPTFIVPGFARIVERDTNELTALKSRKKKTTFLSKFRKQKNNMVPEYKQKPNENLSQELITQFSKHLQNKKLEERK